MLVDVLAVLESTGSGLGHLSALAGLHSWFTGLRMGNLTEAVERLEERHRKIEILLKERILMIPSLQQVHPLHDKPQVLEDGDAIRKMVEPVQTALGSPILLSSVLATPPKLREALGSRPHEVLMNVTPIRDVKNRPATTNLVPVVFFQEKEWLVGWQTRGVLPLLFDFEFRPLDRATALSTPAASMGPVSTVDAEDRLILDLPAERTLLFNVHRGCRIKLTQYHLSFIDRESELHSFALRRSEIVFRRIDRNDHVLEIKSRAGRKYRIQSSLTVLEKIADELDCF